ncbi:hypothetical protein PI124_g18072 [Phytophthora idaei]|nr:hypothetical protein PI125_g19432 [Phytophthora idaei]KAG3137545.1 hypothetical protein PI126_g17345 [Phytophthora idaei]KAG3236924.1 hypothetical protein PI124_g18072 [Phytophthora idaei]
MTTLIEELQGARAGRPTTTNADRLKVKAVKPPQQSPQRFIKKPEGSLPSLPEEWGQRLLQLVSSGGLGASGAEYESQPVPIESTKNQDQTKRSGNGQQHREQARPSITTDMNGSLDIT